jgi:hypothetical protein
MRRVTIEVEISEETAAALAELAARCNDCCSISDGFASHGSGFNPAKMLAMLAEDAGKIVIQPESWQSANMARVLAAHGYMVGKLQAI